ncbi:MAG TPA: hypothetical protein DDW52_08465 [Planctomycetaceae bacterium]|nr:hypothetical protein [Planctomycetaceae bacterium]
MNQSNARPTGLSCVLCVCVLLLANSAVADDIRFDRDVRPILSDKCFHCHGPDEENRAADLRLDLEDAAKEDAIEAGDAAASMVVERIESDDPDLVMPPPEAKKELSAAEIKILKLWIDQGADWRGHWSFESLPDSKAELSPPRSADAASAVSLDDTAAVIDAFVAQELNERGLSPTPPASREILLRRLTLDLTGLPPTLEEIDNYLADEQPGATERVIDRLLASPQFGERMAIPWLDAARYGDTSVYHADGPRDMWAWRDAIVAAYNDNMPFDEFSISQLAGDLLPDANLQQKILSGFNRNNGTTDEGGAIAEEYRVEYAVDRVKTTATTWLGLTMECGQCHDHKYDPISQKEYYQFYAFFNVSSDGGMQTRKGNAKPILEIPNTANVAPLRQATAELDKLKEQLAQRRQVAEAGLDDWIARERENLAPSPTPPTSYFESNLVSNGDVIQGFAGDETVGGKVSGKLKPTTSPRGAANQFQGKTAIDFGDLGDFENDQAFSLSAWIRPKKGVGAVIARMDDSDNFRGYDLYAGTGGLSMHIIHHWPDDAIKVTTKEKLKADQWYHVAASYDGSGKAAGIRLYINGSEKPWNIEQDGLTGTIRTEKSLLVGSRHPGSKFNGDIQHVAIYSAALDTHQATRLAAGSPAALLETKQALSEQETEQLLSHYLAEYDSQHQELAKQTARLESRVSELKKPLTSVMVMGDQEQPRMTYILSRGAYDSPTETAVQPGTPAALPPMPDDYPKNRLGLAKWMFMPENPLTARVAVNRYWQMLFGTGLVATPSDFGAQGSFPTHPELLDWLAVDFRDSGWDIKRLIKQICLSETYQRSSSDPASYQQDPANQWLARGGRFRLDGEFVRDLALATSGLLNPKMGGPGVKPYQPPGLWAEVGLGGNPKFKQDHGEKLYRRSLYTYWKRSAPPPSMQIFDAPTREKCTLGRPRTNTPLQAFVVLNDPQFVEAARSLAERVITSQSTTEQRLTMAYRLATSRQPSATTLDNLSSLVTSLLEHYRSSPADAQALLDVGESSARNDLPEEELAAFTIACSTIYNLDESLTRP